MSEGAAAHGSGELAVPSAGRFYVRVAWALLGIGVVGFAPSYWVPMLRGTLQLGALPHIHALFFYGWLVLFVWQASLVASGRAARHREVGVAGVSVATAMCFVGVAMALAMVRRQQAAGFEAAALAFAVVPLTDIPLFAALFTIAVTNVKRPEIHRRFMIAATVSLLPAAVARWFLLFFAPPRPPGSVGPLPPPPAFVPLIPSLIVDLVIVALMVRDRRTRGRVHAAYWVALTMVVAVHVLRVPLGETGAWTATVSWLLTLIP